MRDRIAVIDFGSQYTQLIARRIREEGVFSEIHPYSAAVADVEGPDLRGVVLSGGPSSVYDAGAPALNPRFLCLRRPTGEKVPTLGICYGLQAIAHLHGGTVTRASRREFGRARLTIDRQDPLLRDIPSGSVVWMSHSDHIQSLPEGYTVIAHTENAPVAAARNADGSIYGVQFHPEVVHSDHGRQILQNFAINVAGAAGDWTTESFVSDMKATIKKLVGDEEVILGLSGGVDSSVAAVLLHDAIGDRLTCIFVDNGLLRAGERDQVAATFKDNFQIRLRIVDAAEVFLQGLDGVADAEEKRRRIGRTFVEVFERETDLLSSELGRRPRYLAQGTLYPDVIESVSSKGPSHTIKTHHNVGGLPDDLPFEILEPFRELFKDEVREIGRLLGVPDEIVSRHPFPGPGLAVRILGPVDDAKLEIVRAADHIFISELRAHGLYHDVWQALAVLLPIRSVGVMGDVRTYEFVCALRAVTSVDGMTADWARIPDEFLAYVSNRIVNEVSGINRVVYDISSKPPATIEWE